MDTPQAPIPNNSQLIYIPSAIFIVICPIVVMLRVHDRYRRHGQLGGDDWSAVAALVFQVLTIAFLLISCQFGMGRHVADISDKNMSEVSKYFYMSQVTYKLTINLTKCSILLLYVSIFGHIIWMNRTCWCLFVCVAMYCLSSVAATVFQCDPIAKAFNKTLPGTCIDLAKFWLANAGFSIATDVIILLLPIPEVYGLQGPWSYKMAVILVFATGICVVIASCLRVTTLDVFASSPDNTYSIANVMYTIIECSIALICASLQPLGRFFNLCRIFSNRRTEEGIPTDLAHTARGDVRTQDSDDSEAAYPAEQPYITGAAGSLRSSRSQDVMLSRIGTKD
ncbi:putative PTH11-typeG-protein-coupled receptor [Trichoderma velutinum]